MGKKNLPIKLVLQKETDLKRNEGGGQLKFFGGITQELKRNIIIGLDSLVSFYEEVFDENKNIPAVGKITVKDDAIAKSYKPNDFCRKCPIIGSADLGEIFIKINKRSIEETKRLIQNPPSERFQANMTAISKIEPVFAEEKLSYALKEIIKEDNLNQVNNRIKLKIFDFDDEFDNSQIMNYIIRKLTEFGFADRFEIISYGESIRYIKIETQTYADIIKLASINGVKSVDFFQDYALPLNELVNTDLNSLLDGNYSDSDITIGIIDGGISPNNKFLNPYVVAREEYVDKAYQNHSHATFIASMIQYGNKLNNILTTTNKKFKFVDIIAMPNGDIEAGPVDTLSEEELMEIIEETMEKYSSKTKIWNLSLGIMNKVCDGTMSDLGIFLDYIQDKYNVQIFVSSGNLEPPLRTWVPQNSMGERDRIISPADSVRAITVGSIALFDSKDSIVKRNEPSPFSRRGPGASYIIKPDVVDYGGNITTSFDIAGIGMKGLDVKGNIVEGIGTSYSTPRCAQKFAAVYDEMVEKDLLLAKAMLIHSAKINFRSIVDSSNVNYYGNGMPGNNAEEILQCSEDEVTLVFKQNIKQGSHLEMIDFPYPKSLIRDGKCLGEICMTLVYNPFLDERFGAEYCRANIDVSFGTYKYDDNGKMKFKGCVPLDTTWDEKYERSRVQNGLKWCPIKSYYRKLSKGIQVEEGWKLRIDMSPRNETPVPNQEFVLIVTIKDPDGNDIYSDVVNGLRERGYVTNNLETRYQVRGRRN